MLTKPMQTMCKQIEEKLKQAFSPVYLMILDESEQHNVQQGAESHFKIILVTEKFASQRMVARHRAIYQILAEELSNSVHALALHTYTPTEWTQRQHLAFSSPACRGGNQINRG